MLPRVILGAWAHRPDILPAGEVRLNFRQRTVQRGRAIAHMTPATMRLACAFFARPGGITMFELVDVLYGERADGGPDDAGRAVRVLLHELRERLRPLGIALRCLGKSAFIVEVDGVERVARLPPRRAMQGERRAAA